MKKLKRILSILLIITIVFSIFTLLTGCNDDEEYITSVKQLQDGGDDYTIAFNPGSAPDYNSGIEFPKAKKIYNQTAIEGYESVAKGKVDAFVYSKIFMDLVLETNEYDNLKIIEGNLKPSEIAVGINPNRTDLVDPINNALKKFKDEGIIDDMYNRWVVEKNETMPEIAVPEKPDKTLRIGTAGLVPPMNFFGNNNELTGFDVELYRRLALELNANFKADYYDFSMLITELEYNNLDIVVSNLNKSSEREKKIIYSEPYLYEDTAVLVRKPSVITSIKQLDGKNIGMLSGSAYKEKMKEKYPNSTRLEKMSYADLLQDLKTGRLDAYVTDAPQAIKQMQKASKGYKILDNYITDEAFGFIIQKGNNALKSNVDAIINELKESKELERFEKKWLTLSGSQEMDCALNSWDTSNGTIRIAYAVDSDPFAFSRDTEVVGYDVEIMYKIAQKLKMEIAYDVIDFNGILASIKTGKSNIAIGCITITEERSEEVDFSTPVYYSGSVAVVLDGEVEKPNFFDNLSDSFERTFIRENRWKLILQGLGVTMELALCTLVIGTVLGIGFSFLLRSKNKVVSKISNIISVIINGLPILIILMVLYYIIFAKSSLSAVVIGVIGLSIDFADAVAGMMNTGVSAVDKGQIEVATSMGYPKWKIFTKIIFPQATNHMFSQYIGAVISMIKGTSIIGYISVIDLTKAGDIIRSRTYEAFFPLITTAIIYFFISQVFIFVLKLLAKKLNPKHRKRMVKGVNIND